MIVLHQGPVEVAWRGRERVDKRLSVKGRLTNAGGYMRPGHERSVTEERNPPEGDPRRFQVKDGLKQRLRSPMDDGRHLWWQHVLGTRPEIVYDFGPYQRRGGIVTPCWRPEASVQSWGSASSKSTGRYQTK
jgi:hypothetical protein